MGVVVLERDSASWAPAIPLSKVMPSHSHICTTAIMHSAGRNLGAGLHILEQESGQWAGQLGTAPHARLLCVLQNSPMSGLRYIC